MTGRITLVGAGELMAAMSGLHRAALQKLGAPAKPVFLDTAAGFETNVDAIAEKAVEYYAHHLQTELRVARYRHRERESANDTAAAVAAIRDANLIFAGPGSPTYAIRQWQDSPVWEAVVQRFEAGADIFFASAASICLGRYALPVYEIYKAGEDPYWADGLDLLGEMGLALAVVPHYDDSSGGENYDSRFCYMGARRFDILQGCLPPEVSILGIDAYTAICFDPSTRQASISGQGGITVIGEGGVRRYEGGSTLPFEAFKSAAREVVQTFDAGQQVSGYAFADTDEENDGPLAALTAAINANTSMTGNEKVDLLAKLQSLSEGGIGPSETEDQLVDLVLELRQGLREAKRFDLADRARDALVDAGFEVQDHPGGARWSRP
jgi:cyanophycinase-like exopeptidase